MCIFSDHLVMVVIKASLLLSEAFKADSFDPAGKPGAVYFVSSGSSCMESRQIFRNNFTD